MPDAPSLSTSAFERVDSRTDRTMVLPFLTVRTDTALYEDPDFRERVAPLLREGEDRSPRSAFTTHLSFLPRIPGGKMPSAVVDIAARHASREFADSLEADGLVDVERVGEETLSVEHGRPIRLFEYRAGFPLSGEELLGESGKPLLRVGVLAAIWPAGSTFEMAGGIFPLEALSAVADRAGAPLVTDCRIDPTPDADRDRIRSFVRRTAAD
ncbi:hypothetical protein ACKVMT_15530 [Halobacteriales archaeon Cl-PHB]